MTLDKCCKIISILLLVLSAAAVNILLLGAGEVDEKKSPIPSKEKLTASAKLVNDIFGADVKNANSAEAKIKLANLLFQQGKECEPKSSDRYVCFSQAIALASQGGDATLSMVIIDDLAKEFRIDALDKKRKALDVVGQNLEGADNNRAFVEMLLPMIHKAVDEDDYKVAFKLGELALNAAKKAKSIALVKAVQNRNKEVQAVHKGFARLAPFLKRLESNPKDGEANSQMGSYYGLLKGKWQRALPYLARGDDKELGRLARMDLAKPTDAPAQLAVADGWWELAREKDDPAQLNIQRRAMVWYDKAIVALRGLNRTKALRRIDQVTAKLAKIPVQAGPVGKVGEIAVFKGHSDEVKSVSLSNDNRYVASGSVDQTVKVWDIPAGKLASDLKGHTKMVWSVDFHPNNQQVASASWDTTARLWNFKTGSEVKRYSHPIDVNGVKFSRDGASLLVGCDNQKSYLWKTDSAQQVRTFPGHNGFTYGVAFSPDGRYVASGSIDRTAALYDKSNGQKLYTFNHQNPVYDVVFSPDGRYLFTSGDDVAHMWDVKSGKEVRKFKGHDGLVLSVAVSGNGRRLLTGGDDRTVRLWDVATGKELAKMTGHKDGVNSVDISANGRLGVSGGRDNTVRVWGLPLR